ncbi:MAG: creatininase family protein [Pseudonocardiaceae bacterium]
MSSGYRWYGSLSAPEVSAALSADSVLCLPIGSYEQYGPHLPLHTDTVIAERFTLRLVTRYGDEHDGRSSTGVPPGRGVPAIPPSPTLGITGGDPRTATAQLGEAIVDSAIAAIASTLDKL